MAKWLNVEKEVELLSTGAKKTWRNKLSDNEYVKEKYDLISKEVDNLKQLYLAQIIKLDLEAKNKYNAKTNDELAKRDTKKNLAKISTINSIYGDISDAARSTWEIVNSDIVKRETERVNKKTSKNTK